jgi:hypothetical protein
LRYCKLLSHSSLSLRVYRWSARRDSFASKRSVSRTAPKTRELYLHWSITAARFVQKLWL